jgi:pyruvate formate lyase activating enzyme
MYKMKDVARTGIDVLRRGIEAGKAAGLKHVYAGNIAGESENTICPACQEIQVERMGYRIVKNSVIDGRCSRCGSILAGVWS